MCYKIIHNEIAILNDDFLCFRSLHTIGRSLSYQTKADHIEFWWRQIGYEKCGVWHFGGNNLCVQLTARMQHVALSQQLFFVFQIVVLFSSQWRFTVNKWQQTLNYIKGLSLNQNAKTANNTINNCSSSIKDKSAAVLRCTQSTLRRQYS